VATATQATVTRISADSARMASVVLSSLATRRALARNLVHAVAHLGTAAALQTTAELVIATLGRAAERQGGREAGRRCYTVCCWSKA
jgi:hypothetical protein